ncbi:porin [Paraburkholderia phytofirmans]|uniref:porin n=1 Tax=Paraburkholderia phytofirmans TaxID=261302 RepID=UPI0038BA8347
MDQQRPRASRYFLDSGAMSGNRWGLTGKESLGGGVSTVFTLEGDFNVANGALGQNGAFFGRQVLLG